MKTAGPGVTEIRVRTKPVRFRVIYLATLPDYVLVLHAFQKKTEQTAQRDIDLAARRLAGMDAITMESETFASVWDALCDTREEAANMRARSELMLAIEKRVKEWDLPLEDAARRLGLTRPRLSDLMGRKINRFSLDALVNIATASGLALHIEVSEAT